MSDITVNNPNLTPAVVTVQEKNSVSINQIESVSATILDKFSILGVNAGSDKNYVHYQNTASATWVIIHNLVKKPSVVVVSSADDVVYGEIKYDSDNQVTITFSGEFSGRAYLN